ncbi:YdaS family helix-turn-helix protein [Glaciecola sp. 2405UD65-10]|uniref:YdaS family helix-turn-helix protein n=1 Tax=Glaciecola sp. 2405UD65-10 TaxID=3397244 RepID=UPI003B5C19B4
MKKINKSEIAKHFGVSRQAVYEWFKAGIPSNRVLELEKVTGTPRHELRPDLYPPEEYKEVS